MEFTNNFSNYILYTIAFFGSRRFIAIFTRHCEWPLFRGRRMLYKTQ